MAPSRKQQQNSPAPEDNVLTPERSPIRKTLIITQRQKQALIDNLQLEITERARRLRAQYALQAQSLRSKLERRVSRVPPAKRKEIMGELLLKFIAAKEADTKSKTVQVVKKAAVRKDLANIERPINPVASPKSRGTKRKSGEVHDQDKENTPDPSAAPVAKRQARDVAGGRTNPALVLSPKSNNSRTLVQSPVRPPFDTTTKPVPRPNSPLKNTSSPFKSAAAAATAGLANMVSGKSSKAPAVLSRTNSKTMKVPARPTKAVQPRTVSSASNTSGTSGTSTGTIVRKVGAAIKSSVAPKKTASTTSRAVASKKAATTKTKIEPAKVEPTAARRTLRKRP